jgi:hypothetical protein
MSVFCAKCGEELLGAINRCWRCGTEYESRSGQIDVPPRRRPPILVPLEGALEAEVIDSVADEVDFTDSHTSHDAANQDAQNSPTTTMRRGSPFRTEELDPAVDSVESYEPSGQPTATVYPKYGGAAVGSFVAMTLGLLSLGLAFFVPIAGGIIAAVGVALGVWGLHSKRRNAAILGLLICCAAVTLSGFFGAIDLYQSLYGFPPWETGVYPVQ